MGEWTPTDIATLAVAALELALQLLKGLGEGVSQEAITPGPSAEAEMEAHKAWARLESAARAVGLAAADEAPRDPA